MNSTFSRWYGRAKGAVDGGNPLTHRRQPGPGSRPTPSLCASPGRSVLEGLAGDRIEEQGGVIAVLAMEIEHVVQRSGERVEGTGDPRQAPVVLHELHDRGQVGDGVVDRVVLRPRRDHQQRQPGAEAASAVLAGERRGLARVATEAGAVEEVLRTRRGGHVRRVRRVTDAAEDVVVV